MIVKSIKYPLRVGMVRGLSRPCLDFDMFGRERKMSGPTVGEYIYKRNPINRYKT